VFKLLKEKDLAVGIILFTVVFVISTP